ncbi:MAG: hypothetical protein WKF37_06035 [Bryobacteraceae bacterium]
MTVFFRREESAIASTANAGDSIHWAGRVDGLIRLTFDGNRVYSQRMQGAALTDEEADSGVSLPRSPVNVEVRRLRGRGDVRVVQQPASGNGYRLILDVEDTAAGADFYEFELRW